MKWKEFKEWAESQGVTDSTTLAFEQYKFGGNGGELSSNDFIVDLHENELRFESKWYGCCVGITS